MNKKIKRIDLAEYMPDIERLISEGLSVPLTVTGNSMSPFLIHMRDTVYISLPVKPFERGDIVLYRRENGQYVMHRIHHIDKYGNLYITGDAQTQIEGPVNQKCVVGEVFTVLRNGKQIGVSDKIWKFYQKVWIRIVPIRPIMKKVFKVFAR